MRSEAAESEQRKPWGRARLFRGLAYHEHAKAFVTRWPPPTTFSVKAFDDFAAERGIYQRPEVKDHHDPLWLGHIHRRSAFKAHLNTAGAHSRMTDDDSTPFFIMVFKRGETWQVRFLHETYRDPRLLKPVHDAMHTLRRRITHLLQGMNWRDERLPEWEIEFATELFYDIVDSEKDVDKIVERIITRYSRLEARIRKAMQSGKKLRSIHQIIQQEKQRDQIDLL